jgi:hypothetical protein
LGGSVTRGEPGRSGTKPDDPDDAAAELEGDGEELEQLDEDHVCKARNDVVVDDVEDVVDGDEDATRRTKECGATTRRGGAATTLVLVEVHAY